MSSADQNVTQSESELRKNTIKRLAKRKHPLTLERIRGLILFMVQRSEATFHCGELARATGVSADTIRHYERIGVLPKAVRSPSGYRIYPKSAVERVRS